MVEVRRKTALQRHAAQAVGPESRFGGIQFRTFSVVLRGRVGSRGRRVDGAWSGSGLSFGLLLY